MHLLSYTSASTARSNSSQHSLDNRLDVALRQPVEQTAHSAGDLVLRLGLGRPAQGGRHVLGRRRRRRRLGRLVLF